MNNKHSINVQSTTKSKREICENFYNKGYVLEQKYEQIKNYLLKLTFKKARNPRIIKNCLKQIIKLNHSNFFNEVKNAPKYIKSNTYLPSPVDSFLYSSMGITKNTDKNIQKFSSDSQNTLRKYRKQGFHFFIFNDFTKYPRLVNAEDLYDYFFNFLQYLDNSVDDIAYYNHLD